MDEYELIGMLYTAAQTALLACVRYWLYKGSLRVQARLMYALLFLLCVGGTLLWRLTGVPFSVFRIALAIILFGVSCFVIKEPFFKHTYTYSFIMVYDAAIEMTASFLQSRIAPGPRGAVFVLSAALLVAVSFVFVVRCLKRMIERLSAAGHDRLWGWLCLISFSFVFMNLLFTYPAAVPSVPGLISRYLMLLGVVGLYVATTRALETMRRAADAQAELAFERRRVALQENYYSRMIAQMEEVRRMRHDLRHHRSAILAMVKSGDMAALAGYADAATAEAGEALPVTGNLAADSVLLYYMDAARALSSRVETSLAIGRKTPLSDPDLCVILGNLLENAVDAQRYVEPESRFIRVTARGGENSLTLAVDNRFDGRLIRGENGEYLSRKTGEGHGLGLGSVRVVCQKYGGILQLETEGDMFMAGVVIGI